jgi:hypothetical protein
VPIFWNVLARRTRDAQAFDDSERENGGGLASRAPARRWYHLHARWREASLPRAQEILEEDRGDFDEEELARLSKEAGQRWAHQISPAAQSAADTADVAQDRAQPAAQAGGHRMRRAIDRLVSRDPPDTPSDPFGL